MIKVFISQPMKNKSDNEILNERKNAIEEIENTFGDKNIEIIDSFFQHAPVNAKPLWFLGKAIETLSSADVAYFTPGWEKARGCKIENLCAKEYGVTVIEK